MIGAIIATIITVQSQKRKTMVVAPMSHVLHMQSQDDGAGGSTGGGAKEVFDSNLAYESHSTPKTDDTIQKPQNFKRDAAENKAAAAAAAATAGAAAADAEANHKPPGEQAVHPDEGR